MKMPRFAYRARNRELHVVEGTIDADSESAALGRLGGQGLFPFSIAEAAAAGSGPRRRGASRRISARTLAYTTRQLADLLGGGLPLLSALTLLVRQTEHPGLERIVDRLAGAVRDGRSLSDALSEHPQVFPPLYVSLVRAGEVGGSLDQALVRLAELGEAQADLRSRIRNAFAYPMFVLILAVVLTIVMMTYVIPTLALVFIESEQLLPLPTRVLLSISRLFTDWWWALLVGGLGLGMLGRWWLKTAGGRVAVDQFLLGLPGFGGLIRRLETARFARSFGVLIRQGVPILQALEVVAQNVGNAVLRRSVGELRVTVGEGSSIAGSLRATGQFPVFVSNMIAVGEESGTVDAALLKVAVAYEREVNQSLQTLTTLLEPILLVGVGGIVMLIVLAMLLPVFQIGLVVQ